jgi:hypothetical protein
LTHKIKYLPWFDSVLSLVRRAGDKKYCIAGAEPDICASPSGSIYNTCKQPKIKEGTQKAPSLNSLVGGRGIEPPNSGMSGASLATCSSRPLNVPIQLFIAIFYDHEIINDTEKKKT